MRLRDALKRHLCVGEARAIAERDALAVQRGAELFANTALHFGPFGHRIQRPAQHRHRCVRAGHRQVHRRAHQLHVCTRVATKKINQIRPASEKNLLHMQM